MVHSRLPKDYGQTECAPDLSPIAPFVAVMLVIAVKRYRQTLD